MARLHGIFGKPYVPLPGVLEGIDLEEIDREITLGLASATLGQTGATLKWMGVVAPWQLDDGFRDAMDAIREMDPREFEEFIGLGQYNHGVRVTREDSFGDETDRPFSAGQIALLTFRHGVYFPWKVCYHLLENDRWEDKHSGTGKQWNPEALSLFPKTLELVRGLPFREMGRVVLFGVMPGDHAPFHRDSEPSSSFGIAQSISIDPRGNKGLCLKNAEEDIPVPITHRAYWFNDMDYHGILPAREFRYSLRVDGVFEPAFVRDLEIATRRRVV